MIWERGGYRILFIPALAGLIFGLAVSIAYVVQTGFWRRWMFWRGGVTVRFVLSDLFELIQVTLVLYVFATYICAFLYSEGAVRAETVPREDGVLEAAALWLGRELLAGIPILRIPETFGLQVPVEFTGVGAGVIITMVRLGLIVPVVAAGTGLYKSVKALSTPIADPLLAVGPPDAPKTSDEKTIS